MSDETLTTEHLDRIRTADRAVLKYENELAVALEVTRAAKANFQQALAQRDGEIREPTGLLPGIAPAPWESVTLEELGITGGLAAKLKDEHLTTLGGLAVYNPEGDFTCVPGIGKIAAGKITDAIEKYWVDNPQPEEPETAGDWASDEGETDE